MKKILIYFVFGLFVSLSATAQNSVSVNMYNVANPSSKVLVKERHRDSLSTISCSNSKSGGIYNATFIHSNSNMTARHAIVANIQVNDMVIENDMLYFCGKRLDTTTGGWSGIIGYFNIGGVFFGSDQIVIESGFQAGESRYPVDEFTRMVCFCRDYTPPMHVACIGTCHIDTTYPCLVDLEISPFPVYSAGCVNRVFETFTDIKQVQNGMVGSYFLTSGYDIEYDRYINIRIYKENNFFDASGLQNWCHVFCFDPSGLTRPWLDGGVLLAGIDGSTFATVSYRTYKKPLLDEDDRVTEPPANARIHLAIYKTNLIAYHSVYAMQKNYEIASFSTSGREMNEFLYNNKTQSLAFLCSNQPAGSGTTWFSRCSDFKPSALSSSGTVQAYHSVDIKQNGLSTYWNNNKYVVSGYDQITPTTLNFNMNTFSVLSECNNPVDYRYDELKTIDSRNFEREFTVFYGVPDKENVTPEGPRIPLYIDCESE